MSQTQTSPVRSSPRILRRVASASALNRPSISSSCFAIYIRLDKYITSPYSSYIRLPGYRGEMTDIQRAVREKYGSIATSVRDTAKAEKVGCCGPAAGGWGDPITAKLNSDAEINGLPAEAVLASLGCGNPTALVDLQPGQTVLDLGSGGGIDVLLSAKRVGPTGRVYGLDMTDEMLALARENQRKAGAENVEFLKGTIESMTLPDNSVDVIISKCVINMSSDKDAV